LPSMAGAFGARGAFTLGGAAGAAGLMTRWPSMVKGASA
jgi:hypothetical protein